METEIGLERTSPEDATRACLATYSQQMHDRHRQRKLDQLAEYARISWPDTYAMQHITNSPNSYAATLDPDVYVGCLERLENYFFWTNAHWALPKSSLVACP